MMHELSKLDLIHKEAKSVTGQTMGENFADAVITRPDVIHSVENPYRKTGRHCCTQRQYRPRLQA